MNEQQTMLADTASGLFAELSHRAIVADDWSSIEEMGFTGLLLSEADGGFGGNWVDAGIVFRLVGYHALALPLVEAVIAARLASSVGFELAGIGTIAERTDGKLESGRFTGTVRGAAWGRDASYVVAPSPDGGALILPTADAVIEQRCNVADEPRLKNTK